MKAVLKLSLFKFFQISINLKTTSKHFTKKILCTTVLQRQAKIMNCVYCFCHGRRSCVLNFVAGELSEVSKEKQKKIKFLLLILAKVFNNSDAMGTFCSS